MTLLAPAFLAGLLAIGLPLWLHRLSSENPNRQRFSSLMFLEPGEPRRVLAKKLQYLLLLALRIAFLVLLALTFAQPAFWRSPGDLGAGDGARLHLVVLDRSASMSYDDRWEEALDAARDVIGDMGADDRGLVLAAGRTIEVLPGAPTADRSELQRVLAAVEPSTFRIDYGQLMRSVEGVLRSAELPAVVHFVTDVQQTAMPTRFAELAPRRAAQIVVHDVTDGEPRNWAIESLTMSAEDGALEASIRSFSAEPAERTVEVSLNGTMLERSTIEVPAGGRAAVKVTAPELAAGGNRIVARLVQGDGLTVDDERFLALRRPEPRSALIVAADTEGLEVRYVEAAIAALDALELTPEFARPIELSRRELRDFSLVVVTDVGLLDSAMEAQLRTYVEGGGGLLLAARSPRSLSVSTVPVTGHTRPSRTLSGPEVLKVGDIDSQHPALRGVGDLRTAEFRRYLGVEPGPEDRVLVALENGAPLLLERTLGAGRVLLFTSSLDREWNDLPPKPVFVTFMAGLANQLLGGEGLSSEAELGSTLAVSALGLRGGQIFDPRGERALGLGATGADVVLDRPGFWVVEGGGTSRLVAVNVDQRESDLTPAAAQTVENWQALGVSDSPAGAAFAGEDAERTLRPVGLWLLILLIAAALMESLAGNWHLRIRRGIAA